MLFVSLLIFILPFTLTLTPAQAQQVDKKDAAQELVGASSEESGLSSSSHKVVASGWPATSSMWPSVASADDQSGKLNSSSAWLSMVEPFIFADKPRSIDYSLLLSVNASILNMLRNHLKPMSLNLSFEYYFNHDPKITAVPGIKVEVDRKQFKYLEPGSDLIKTRMWIKFNERIIISNPQQFDNHDWLKFSLVNRQSPSIVAIRKLKVEFLMNVTGEQSATLSSAPTPVPAVSALPTSDSKQLPASVVLPLPGGAKPAGQARQISALPSGISAPAVNGLDPTREADFYSKDLLPDASNTLNSSIEPVGAKKSGWGWGRKRKRRDTLETGAEKNNTLTLLPDSIVLTCYESERCDWKPEVGEEIHWSLVRMPPSTETVRSGYYYVSNRSKYGDPSKLLSLHLQQTDSATVADQNADHCLELAFYVTEQSYLRLYQLINTTSSDGSGDTWTRKNLLLTWSPTLAVDTNSRSRLPNAQLPSMESGNNGWTQELLCFGDFFTNSKDCGAGKCAFGFEMVTDVAKHQKQPVQADDANLGIITSSIPAEQVVGVALLREYSINVPIRASRNNWLQAWQRDEVRPDDNWKYYPKFDVKVSNSNASFVNMFDDAHFYLASDWLDLDQHLDLSATLILESILDTDQASSNQTNTPLSETDSTPASQIYNDMPLFQLRVSTKLVDSQYDVIYTANSSIDWTDRNNNSVEFYNLGFSITDSVTSARNGRLKLSDSDSSLFKIVIEFIFDSHWLTWDSSLFKHLIERNVTFAIALANVSLSDRCFPNPCQYGSCQQNGTNFEDWNCHCDDKHRGRRCDFGRWCNIAHVTPWTPPSSLTKTGQPFVIKAPLVAAQRQPKLVADGITRISGKEYCSRKLGQGAECTDMDIPLNDNLYTEDDKTFTCSCQADFYLSDESKCKQAHVCNSVLCPSLGMICDESKPFNASQPCHCNEKQDWFPDPEDPSNKCIRRQCQDKLRDCGFEAHTCLPTLVGDKPICKCGPKFTIATTEKGQKYCQSTACVLPTLNDCQQVCQANNSNLDRPFTCSCHPGFVLNPDGRTCSESRPKGPYCKPSCNLDTQICTDVGCKCKQGYVGEGEVIIQQQPSQKSRNNFTAPFDYVKSVRCLNICSLSYSENNEEFKKVESVCPLGLCDPESFQCRCTDPTSSALINTKYEPIYSNSSIQDEPRKRVSPLCHLRRVCSPDSSSYQICHSQGAICVPDYTKAAMFDCVCPPSTEKKFYGQGTSGEFTCEPRCSAKKYDCLRRQAVCKLVDKDQVRCECLPGLMFNQRDQKCYLALYSYAFNLIVANRYYEPETRFHRIESLNTTLVEPDDESHGQHEENQTEHLDLVDASGVPSQFRKQTTTIKRSTFIAELNQCNITQVIPKSVIEDPYEHDIESFLGYIDQCNEKIHQNMRTYHLNSKLGEDVRQSLRQHLRDFTVTTSNSTCVETDSSGLFLNCTIYLQSNEPVQSDIVEYVFSNCDKNGQDHRYCWIKPRLLLEKKPAARDTRSATTPAKSVIGINFHQIVACEIDNFCGQDAYSVRTDDRTSLCSCKCPLDIEVIDVKDLESRLPDSDPSRIVVKEVCAPRNLCGTNSTFCLQKAGSICHYDIRLGSRCLCVYPSYEDNDGRCVEVAYSRLDNTLIVIIILLGTGLIISIAINLTALIKSKSMFGKSKQYPLNEYPRTVNRSTGIPNPGFTND